MIPGIIYKKGMANFLFEIGELELNRAISTNGEFSLLNVNLNGENKRALIKEIQRDPVNRKIIHLDLEETSGNEKIISNVPIKFIGEDASIGSVYKISDLEIAKEISIIDNIDSVIASISYEQKIVEAID